MCFASDTDSPAVMSAATNYPFLLALATDRSADPAIVDMAVERALLLRGPTKVFADLAVWYRSDPYLLELRIHKLIRARMQRRNAWIRGIELKPSAFREAGFGAQQAGVVAMEIAKRLRRGEEWTRLHDEYRSRYRWPNGCTLIWDSSYVTSEGRDEKAPRHELVPSYHLPRLLRARAGDALVLTVRPTAWDYTRSLLLWQVLDVYEPSPRQVASAGPAQR